MYTYLLAYASAAAGETHVATVFDAAGAALGSQPAGAVHDLGAGAYLYVTAAMPDGQTGAVVVTNSGALVTVAVVSPLETEGIGALLASHTTPDSLAWALRLTRGFIAGKKVVDLTVVPPVLKIYDLDGVTLLATVDLTIATSTATQVPA